MLITLNPVQARRLGVHDAAKAFAAERRTLAVPLRATGAPE